MFKTPTFFYSDHFLPDLVQSTQCRELLSSSLQHSQADYGTVPS